MKWFSNAQFLARLEQGGRKLGLVVQENDGETWGVMALETTADGSIDAVLDDHAHKVVGYYDNLSEAFLAAESFAAAWQKGHRTTAMEKCDCAEIESR